MVQEGGQDFGNELSHQPAEIIMEVKGTNIRGREDKLCEVH